MSSQRVITVLAASLLAVSILLWVGNMGCRSRSQTTRTTSRSTALPTPDHKRSPLSSAASASKATHQRFQASVRRTRYVLTSHKPYQEVQVPLIFHDGRPFVQTYWSGRQIECMVDTGTNRIIYPRWLHLHEQPLHIPGSILGTHGRPARSEWGVTPSISLGDFSVYNAVTVVEDVPQSVASAPLAQTVPILGMQTFLGVVATIDYASKTLTMRSRGYDITHEPHRPHSLLSHFPTDRNPAVVVPGTLGGHPAQLLLDTGCKGLLINSSYAHKYLSVVPIRYPSHMGTFKAATTWPGVRRVSCTLLGQHFVAPLADVDERTFSADALVGARWFERYRITVDYNRGMVLMEPNSLSP